MQQMGWTTHKDASARPHKSNVVWSIIDTRINRGIREILNPP